MLFKLVSSDIEMTKHLLAYKIRTECTIKRLYEKNSWEDDIKEKKGQKRG